MFQLFSWVRWAITFGGGIGFLIGVFEVRAITRKVEAERIRFRQEELQEERDRLERRERTVMALHDAAHHLDGAETKQEIYDILVESAEEILDFALVAVDVRENDTLVQKAWSLDQDDEGYYARTSLDEDTLATRAYRRGETIVADDLREYDITPADPEYLSALTVPIGDIGTFQTVSREVNAYDRTDRVLAELLVDHALAAIVRLEQTASLRKQRERLQRENERLETMAQMLSHDLRNPLAVAEGNVELAMEEYDSEELEKARSALGRMNDLIEDVLTWVREGMHVSPEETTDVDLAALASRSWQNVDVTEATVDVESTQRIRADESRLQHVFENLFRNAVQHGGKEVTIRIGDLEEGFYIEDDGPGIAPEERENVFESGYSTGDEETGLGLSIVQEIVEAHDWEIAVTESTEGGARFEITNVDIVDE
ncbi:MAG: sensor histidine kinase [Halodesulfurarchaeum sp.]